MSENRQNSFELPHRLGRHLALFLFLLAVYLLTYTPHINSSDGLAMFATAENLVRRGALDIEQIRWLDLQQGTFGLDGLLYSRKGIGLSLGLLPLVWLGLNVPGIGPVGTSLLFNALVTALTAVLLSAYVQRLGYTYHVGLLVALAFGLATLAWPYAKSLFSDSFSGFLLLAAAYLLLRFRSTYPYPTHEQRTINKSSPPTLRLRSGQVFQSFGSAQDKPSHPPALQSSSVAQAHSSILPILRLRSGQTFHSSNLPPLLPALAGLLLAWNVATRYAEVLFIPIYGLLLVWTLRQQRLATSPSDWSWPRRVWLPLFAFVLPLALVGYGLIHFNLARYGDPLNTGYLANETFSADWRDGLIGQLFSPGRGLLLYCPILLLSLAGAIALTRRFQAEGLLALAVILGHLFLYGKWFMWHGGYAWGPRFLIPTLPFWALFLSPIIARGFSTDPQVAQPGLEALPRRPSRLNPLASPPVLRFAFAILFALSLVPQFQTVLLDFAPFQNSLLDAGLPLFDRVTFFDPQYAALFTAWDSLTSGTLDLAWAWQGSFNWPLLTLLGLNLISAGVFLFKQSSPPSTSLRTGPPSLQPSSLAFLLPVLFSLIAGAYLLVHAHSLPPVPLQNAVEALNQGVRPDDAVITNNPDLSEPFAERYAGQAPVLGLNSGGPPLPERIERRLVQIQARHRQIWWLPNWLAPAESAVEQALAADGFRAVNDNYDGQRLVLFAYLAEDIAPITAGINFGHQILLNELVYPPQLEPQSALPIELRWQAVSAPLPDYHVFIHLINQAGQIATQVDGQPGLGSRPTPGWRAGETVIDRHGLWVPNLPPGAYRLRLGLYQSNTGQRLLRPDGRDAVETTVELVGKLNN